MGLIGLGKRTRRPSPFWRVLHMPRCLIWKKWYKKKNEKNERGSERQREIKKKTWEVGSKKKPIDKEIHTIMKVYFE